MKDQYEHNLAVNDIYFFLWGQRFKHFVSVEFHELRPMQAGLEDLNVNNKHSNTQVSPKSKSLNRFQIELQTWLSRVMTSL